MVERLKKIAKKTLENTNVRFERYRISPNGSTVYSKDKEAARKRAQEFGGKLKEKLQGK